MKRMILVAMMLLLGLSLAVAQPITKVDIFSNGLRIAGDPGGPPLAPTPSVATNTEWGGVPEDFKVTKEYIVLNGERFPITVSGIIAMNIGQPPMCFSVDPAIVGTSIEPGQTATLSVTADPEWVLPADFWAMVGIQVKWTATPFPNPPVGLAFRVHVMGTQPEMLVQGKGKDIKNGDMSPTTDDGTVLNDLDKDGNIIRACLSGPAIAKTFQLMNIGDNDPAHPLPSPCPPPSTVYVKAKVTGDPGFSVKLSGGAVDAGKSVDVQVTFAGSAYVPGGYEAVVEIALSYPKDAVYTFKVKAVADPCSELAIYVIDDVNGNGVWDNDEPGIKGVETWIKGQSIDGFDGQKLTGQRGGTSWHGLFWQTYKVQIFPLTLPAGYKITNGSAVRYTKGNHYSHEALVVYLVSKTATGAAASGEESNWGALPSTYEMSQNYPNPFNPTTSINFQLVEDVHVTLQVFDVTGRVVATLVDGQLNAGHHFAEFNASNLPSGAYFYKIQAGNFSATKSMMLLK